MPTPSKPPTGVGASVTRKEDDRYLRGRGQFVGDIKLPGMREVAFLRSPVAHARLRAIHVPAHLKSKVFTMHDMEGVRPIVAVSALPGYKPSKQWPLAKDKIRQVGELVAMCVAPTRAEAEDYAAQIELDLEELPAVVDMLQARHPSAPLLHEEFGDNLYLTSSFNIDIEAAAQKADVKVTREIRTARQCMTPIEGRGVVAQWSERLNQLTVWSSTQMPHIVRNGLSETLGLEQSKVRVVPPDVGGGFGYKGILLPEEICLSWLALRCGHPLRWLEDRREHLTANANCREHHYVMTGYATKDGKLLGVEAKANIDSGAYSSYPFSACLETGQVASNLPSVYRLEGYRADAFAVATNKAPILPYRGVARTGVCFAIELLVDAVARKIKMEPHEFRLRNLVQPEQMPFENITKKYFDSGDYPECLARAVDAIDLQGWRARQKHGEADGRLIGAGTAIYCEQGAHGTSVYAAWGVPMIPGFEQATVRVTPDGGVELRVGTHCHGQGHETTFAQVANEILGVALDKVKLVHGDTEYTPYSTGTWGSRAMVMAGGAIATACRELVPRILRIGAHLLQASLDGVEFKDGHVVGARGKVSLSDVARVWYLAPQDLPGEADAHGLEVTAGYKPKRDTGTFSYAAHAVALAVDSETGMVEILDYVIVEDGGKLVNPMVVEGQTYGGAAQGVGTALYEEMPFDAHGQPLASTLSDYMIPGPTEIPAFRILHMETPSPLTEFGVKGLGEGGAIAPPAAITNAINDALAPLGVEINESPVSPRRILAAIDDARS
ncbi:MAG: xanthine dehydrogenase family protein molybdopterin-binding subunit [Gammaproteobacteria bacterium]